MLLFQISSEKETPEALKAKMEATKKAIMADPALLKAYNESCNMLLRDPEHKVYRELSDLYYRNPAAYSRLIDLITSEASRLADLDMMAAKKLPNAFTYEDLPFNKQGTAKMLPPRVPQAPNEILMKSLQGLNRTLYHMLDIMTDTTKFSKFKKQVLKPQLI